MKKVGIIGVNHVGAHVANALLYQSLADEIYLCDTNTTLCTAQANDLVDAMSFYPRSARIIDCADRYEDLAGCDVLVNAAGHVAAAAGNRDGELFVTSAEAKTFARRIVDAGFAGVIVTIANPNDVIATEIQGLTGYDPRKVIGSGTTLDSARLRHALADATGFDQRSISAWMLGEHGFSEFACWSHITFGSLTVPEVERRTGLTLDRSTFETAATKGGFVTYQGKQCTEYSIANSATEIIKAVLCDAHIITPVSTYIDDVYGESGVYASLPCEVGARGVERVLVPELADDEVQRWHDTCAHIRANVEKVRCW